MPVERKSDTSAHNIQFNLAMPVKAAPHGFVFVRCGAFLQDAPRRDFEISHSMIYSASDNKTRSKSCYKQASFSTSKVKHGQKTIVTHDKRPSVR